MFKLSPERRAELERDFTPTWQENILSWLVGVLLATTTVVVVVLLFKGFSTGDCEQEVRHLRSQLTRMEAALPAADDANTKLLDVIEQEEETR